jgi:hypothetical protein
MQYKANRRLTSHAVDSAGKGQSLAARITLSRQIVVVFSLFDDPAIDGKPALTEEHRAEPIRFGPVLFEMRTLSISNVIRTHRSHPAD